MYRFEKKATLVCAAASLITACCLPLSANVAFAQDSVEAQSIELKADFSSVVSDDLQPDNSSVIKDGWQRDESSGVWYYGKNGKHQTGWLQSGGYWYWLDPANDGAMQTGYFNVTDAGGSTASFYANDGNAATPFGALYQNCWLRNSDGNWFYANAGGDLAADWFYQDGTWYYLDPATHIMQVGFVDLGSGKYYLDATGAMKTGWILVDGNWYWAYSSGALASSWQTIGGARYYFDPQTFIMFKGRQKIDGRTYIFGDYGLANGWYKDGADWYYCSNGIAATGWKLVNGAWYYLDPASDGKMSVGYLDLGNAAYYLKPNGAMAVGWAQVEDGWYFASQSGALISGWYKEGTSWYYLDPVSHLMKTGLFEVGGNDCFANQSGRLVVSSWVTVNDGVQRYANDNGYDGVRRVFWSDGQCDKVGWQNPSQYPQVSSWTVQLPSYCTGYFTYVTPSRISVEATREDCVNAFIQRAYEYIGTQYIEPWSTAPGGAVDCSGFVLQCLYATGMDMGVYNPYNHRWDPSQTYNSMNWYRSNIFMPVSTNSIQRGDVIYYRGHIAIALGGGMMIDSWPHQGVGIHSISARGNVIGAARPFI